MTMRIYKSTDTSAPTLQGIVGGALSGSDWADGSLLQLLRKILVTGYGSQTAAGWTQSFAGTSEGVFKQGSGCNFYIHVLDDGSLTAGAREAAFYGAENMTALSTGTGLFPTVAQQATALKLRKSDTADSTQRSWICFADAKTFYLFTAPTGAYYAGMAFGDFASFFSGDAYNCMAIGRTTSAAVDALTNEALCLTNISASTAEVGHYFARGYNQQGSSVQFANTCTLFNASSPNATSGFGSASALLYPNAPDGKLWVSRAYIEESTTAPGRHVRGYFRGLWAPQCVGANLPLEFNFGGTGGVAGRVFRVLGLPGGVTGSRFLMESSDTWD